MELLDTIPEAFLNFFIVMLFSLFIGLAQKRLHKIETDDDKALFGTDRTFTFIGILGFILYILDPNTFLLYGIGGVLLSILLAVFYFQKINKQQDFGLTSILVAFITYSLGPLVFTQPKWLVILIVVTVLILVELKESFSEISTRFGKDEFITLAKFLTIAGVILPIVPDRQVVDFIPVTPYRVWLAVVVVSSISYLSYLLQKFVFRESGILISGILGGLYSSTAATLIVSRRSKEQSVSPGLYAASIILATSMMFVRLLIIVFIFNADLGYLLLPYFLVLFIVSVLISIILAYGFGGKHDKKHVLQHDANPLELKIAALFAALYIVFSFATQFTLNNYGDSGLMVLSFIVGFTHIDPFLLNIFQGKFEISQTLMAQATLQAILSNNILKGLYAGWLAERKTTYYTMAGLGIVLVVNVIVLLLI